MSNRDACETRGGDLTQLNEAPRLLWDIPKDAPALSRAQEISERAVAVGFEWDTLEDVWDQLRSEELEVRQAYAALQQVRAQNAPASPESLEAQGNSEQEFKRQDKHGQESSSQSKPEEEGNPAQDLENQHKPEQESNSHHKSEQQLKHELELEVGDLLFSVVNLARWMGVDAERALNKSSDKFTERWEHMENAAHLEQRALSQMSTQELEQLWQQAKRAQSGVE